MKREIVLSLLIVSLLAFPSCVANSVDPIPTIVEGKESTYEQASHSQQESTSAEVLQAVQPHEPNFSLEDKLNGNKTDYPHETVVLGSEGQIQYPRFSLPSSEISDKMNLQIERALLPDVEDGLLIDLEYDIVFSNDKLISIFLKGSTYKPAFKQYCFNFDVTTGDNLVLQDFFILNHDFWSEVMRDGYIIRREDLSEDAYMQIMEYVLALETEAFTISQEQNNPSAYFSTTLYYDSSVYFDKETAYICVSLPHAAGDYIIFGVPVSVLYHQY